MRVRASGVRHAVWTLVLVAMLLMPVLPSIVPTFVVAVPRLRWLFRRGMLGLPEAAQPTAISFAGRESLHRGPRGGRIRAT